MTERVPPDHYGIGLEQCRGADPAHKEALAALYAGIAEAIEDTIRERPVGPHLGEVLEIAIWRALNRSLPTVLLYPPDLVAAIADQANPARSIAIVRSRAGRWIVP